MVLLNINMFNAFFVVPWKANNCLGGIISLC